MQSEREEKQLIAELSDLSAQVTNMEHEISKFKNERHTILIECQVNVVIKKF